MAAAAVIVFCTAPTPAVARRLARRLLTRRLAACVSCLAGAESHYWWKGRLERARETLMIIKTSRSRLAEAMRCLAGAHPYTVPELLALPVTAGSRPYLRWLQDACRG